jgi:uridine phosphorylase
MRQYHLGVDKGEIAPYVMLVGDPQRAVNASALLEDRHSWHNREFNTYTGTYKGIPVTVVGTGIGSDNTEIAVIELSECQPDITFIRAGSCGALQQYMWIGDLVVSTGAVRLESTSKFFVPDGYPAVADHNVTAALIKSCKKEAPTEYHVGITATAPGFFGAQGRLTPKFPSKSKDLHKDLARFNVLNMEMEASTLMTLCSISGQKCGVICGVFAKRTDNSMINSNEKVAVEMKTVRAAFGAFEILGNLNNCGTYELQNHSAVR